jgi:hypothetical protein
VVVHVPPGFLPCERPGLIAYVGGFDSCAQIALGSVDGACSTDGGVRSALHLQEQLDAAKVNAILVAIDLQVDSQSSDPGQLANPGAFAALLHELLQEKLTPLLGRSLDVADLDRVVLASYSGGYVAAQAIATNGGVPLHEVDLYDSLYGYVPSFETWVVSQVASFDGTPAGRRFVNVYSTAGGTDANSRTLAASLAMDLSNAGLSAQMLDDTSSAPLTQSDYTHAVIFKLAAVAHVDVPRTYFGQLARASGFASLP